MRDSVHVIGSGLIGMLTARELALAGMAVTIVEQGRAGSESSWAGGGILSPLHPWRYPEALNALASWSQTRYPALAAELYRDTGIDPEFTVSGLLWLDTQEQDRALAWAAQSGSVLRLLSGSEALLGCEPALARGFSGALWAPDIAQIRNPRLLQAVRADLLARGVTIREGLAVTGFGSRNGVLRELVTSQGRLPCETAVVATGAWSGGLLAPTGLVLPIKPIRGQMLLFKARPGVVTRMVLHRDRYVIPRRDGRILVGSTVEDVGFAKATTDEALAELTTAAISMIPALAEFPIERQWAGLRPGSPSGVPYVGEHPHLRGLYVNAGHFRNGVVLGPASCRLIADLVLQRAPCDLVPQLYAPGRTGEEWTEIKAS